MIFNGKNLLIDNFILALRLIIEPVPIIRYKLACAYTKDSNQSVHVQSDQSPSFLPEERSDPWLPKDIPSKIPIRLSVQLHWVI